MCEPTKIILFSIFCFNFVLFICGAVLEGDHCSKDGAQGSCIKIKECQSAIYDLRHKKAPQLCGFLGSEPLVCCPHLTVEAATETVTSVSYPPAENITTPMPAIDVENKTEVCEPIPSILTSKKTGQKAHDMCVEYQSRYVYPCVNGTSRANLCQHLQDQLILGGIKAFKNEFPHMVLLGYGNSTQSARWLCSGVIISDKYVLVAGHCTAGLRGDLKYILAGASSSRDAVNSSNIYQVKTIIRHPEFKPPKRYNDIALLETNNPMTLSEFVTPACLHTGDPIEDDIVVSTGFNSNSVLEESAEELQKVRLQKVSSEECSSIYKIHRWLPQSIDNNTQICYLDKNNFKESCATAGGSVHIKHPSMYCMYIVLGIESFGKCQAEHPLVFSKVSHYLPWIESIVWP